MKIVITQEGKLYVLKNTEQAFHFSGGSISADDLQKTSPHVAISTAGVRCVVLDPVFADLYKKLKRGAQIITPKDAGLILAETLIGKESICLDAGGGSGALTCFLARYAKHIYSYELKEDHIKTINKNIETLGLTNVTVENKDIYEGIDVKNVDLVTLDVPEPQNCLEHVSSALKPGGYLVTYVPCTNQMLEVANAIGEREDMVVIKNVELIERHWRASGRSIRPETQGSIHTGFLTFVRKL